MRMVRNKEFKKEQAKRKRPDKEKVNQKSVCFLNTQASRKSYKSKSMSANVSLR